MKIINERLFYASIVDAFLVVAYSFTFHLALFGLIAVPFAVMSSMDRKYLKLTLIASFISSLIEFPSVFYPISLVLSFYVMFDFMIGTLIVGITDFAFLILYLGYLIINLPVTPFLLLPLSITSTYLGFLSYRGLKGLDYNLVMFKVNNLPNGVTWYLRFNNSVYPVNGNTAKLIARSGTWVICPINLGNEYYIPDVYFGDAKGGDIITVNFRKATSIDPDKYPECTVSFVGKNVPTDFTIYVDSIKYSGKIVTILPSSPSVNWIAEDITIGDLIFEPDVKSGIASIGQRVEITYKPRLLGKRQLDVYSWDPNEWINQNLYGYRIKDVIGEGGGSYVLKGEKDGKYFAVKVLKLTPSKSQTMTLNNFMDLFKESKTFIELSSHEGLVRLYGVFVDLNQIGSVMRGDGDTYLRFPPAIIMEFMEGGTAKDLMRLYSRQKEWYDIVKIIIRQVSIALFYIHSAGYVHLDVKPQNIFFSQKLPSDLNSILSYLSINPKIIRLGDLGSATKMNGKITQITPEYSSPLQLEKAILGIGAEKEMDIFSLGMVTYTMLTNKVSPFAKLLDEGIELYNSNDIRGALKKVDDAKMILSSWKIDIPPDTPIELREVVEGCINGRFRDAKEIAKILSV